MRTIEREIVAALIISKDNKILMGKKDTNKGGVYSDCWHIPGGGVEKNERLEDALHREVLEEVGIDISGAVVRLIDDTGKGTSEKTLKTGENVICNMMFNTYEVLLRELAADTKLTFSDDLVTGEWVEKENLHNYKLTPVSFALFTRLGWIKS